MIHSLQGTVLARTHWGLIVDCNGVGYGVEMPVSHLSAAPAPDERVMLWVETHVREDDLRLFGFLTWEDRQAFGVLRSVTGVGPKIALAVMGTMNARQLRLAVLGGKSEILEGVPGIGKKLAERLILELKSKFEKDKGGTGLLDVADSVRGTLKRQGAARGIAGEPLTGSAAGTKVGQSVGLFDEFAEVDSESLNAVDVADDEAIQIFFDVQSALENFGYKEREIANVVAKLRTNTAGLSDQKEKHTFQDCLRLALAELQKGARQ